MLAIAVLALPRIIAINIATSIRRFNLVICTWESSFYPHSSNMYRLLTFQMTQVTTKEDFRTIFTSYSNTSVKVSWHIRITDYAQPEVVCS